MKRHFDDWLQAYVDHASYTEAPTHFHFWSGVSAVAGALRRRVWIDMAFYKWYCNFYIILVAPPGIVSKSTTADISTKILEEVPKVKFGPNITSWPSLVEAFAESAEAFEVAKGTGDFHVMSPLTLVSSELGNLIDPNDKKLIDLLIDLWDGKQGKVEKRTKNAGTNIIENPWINLIACTTPAWISDNIQEYMLGGGFISRCLFVYAEEKRQLVPYIDESLPADFLDVRRKLSEDLQTISELAGQYRLTREAREWGREWYLAHNRAAHTHLERDRFGGYLARKQNHIHKLAMVLAASCREELVIHADDLSTAAEMVTSLEVDFPTVFAKVGKSETSLYADRLVAYIKLRGAVDYQDAFRHVQAHFPRLRDFEDVLTGCIKAGLIRQELNPSKGRVTLHPGEFSGR